MPKTVKVHPGGREYVVAEKYAGIAEKWRQRLRESSIYKTALSMDGAIEQIAYIVEDGIENLQANRITTLAAIVPNLVIALATSMDEIIELVFDYVPEMRVDREWLMENVYNSEFGEVFLEVLKLNFPILGVLNLIRGLRAPGTFTNLPSTNGDTGTKKRSVRSKTR